MNRRGFIALATAAAVAPQELIAAPVPAPEVLSEAALGAAFSKNLAASMLQTKEMVAARFVVPSVLLEQMRQILNEEFENLYDCIAWEDVFKDPEALGEKVGGGLRASGPEETPSESQGSSSQRRGAGGVHDDASRIESPGPDHWQRR